MTSDTEDTIPAPPPSAQTSTNPPLLASIGNDNVVSFPMGASGINTIPLHLDELDEE